MADILDTITKLIQSPPGQLAAGGILAGIVWKFFERVENVLNEDTKKKISQWLRVRNLETDILAVEAASWPDTFTQIFNRVFGANHFSWNCVVRCSLASLVTSVIALILTLSALLNTYYVRTSPVVVFVVLVVVLLGNIAIDYISMFVKRWSLWAMRATRSTLLWTVILISDALVTLFIATYGTFVSAMANLWIAAPFINAIAPGMNFDVLEQFTDIAWFTGHPLQQLAFGRTLHIWVFLYPAFFTSIWLWLYAGSGFLLKAARRFDIGFEWFNRHFDIERKPLQSIGLVAGALVAMAYWAAVIVSRVVG